MDEFLRRMMIFIGCGIEIIEAAVEGVEEIEDLEFLSEVLDNLNDIQEALGFEIQLRQSGLEVDCPDCNHEMIETGGGFRCPNCKNGFEG